MNTAIILSGGIGSRMKRPDGLPKQYIEVKGKPVIEYCLQTFVTSEDIDGIVIVASESWYDYIEKIFERIGRTKFLGIAKPGIARQNSIFNGLNLVKELAPNTEKIIIHDAVRPLVSQSLIKECLGNLAQADGVMPVLSVKDTCYQSTDGKYVTNLLPREQLYAGQAPEAFNFNSYYLINQNLKEQDLAAVNGSSELVYKKGLNVLLIPGEEKNFKITTLEDLNLFKQYLESEAKV